MPVTPTGRGPIRRPGCRPAGPRWGTYRPAIFACIGAHLLARMLVGRHRSGHERYRRSGACHRHYANSGGSPAWHHPMCRAPPAPLRHHNFRLRTGPYDCITTWTSDNGAILFAVQLPADADSRGGRGRTLRSSAEPSLAPCVVPQGAQEVDSPEGRPVRVDESELGVGGLPQQEPRKARLAASPDHEVRIR